MFKQPIVLTIMRLIVSPLSCRLLCCSSRRSPSRHLISSSISLRSLISSHVFRISIRLSSSPALVPFLSPLLR